MKESKLYLTEIEITDFQSLILECCIKAISMANQSNSNITNQEKDDRLTIAQLADKWQCSKPTIHKQMKLGLPFEKLGRRTLFRRGDVDQYFKQKKG